MARLRHQLLDDDTVLVSLVGAAQQYRVPMGEAKRFAWALLADLDPEEANQAGYVPPTVHHRAEPKPDRVTGPGKWQQKQVLDVLRRGDATANWIAHELGIATKQAQVQLSRLHGEDQIEKVTQGRPGSPGIWRIAQ